ncbi:MAG: hypothetical protein ABI411_19890 [Tahibacter sp.]
MATKKSPRAPSIALDDAIAKVIKIYDKERRHAAPSDVIAQDVGYKSANNGAALSTLASLRYYGLLERPKEGHLAVTKDVETYIYTPDEEVRRELLAKWLRCPPIFLEIIETYSSGLPSDATLRFNLIEQGFAPSTAEALIPIFKRSADFAGLYDPSRTRQQPPPTFHAASEDSSRASSSMKDEFAPPPVGSMTEISPIQTSEKSEGFNHDKIPVRLTQGRRAWLTIPSPFFEADKSRLIAQINLLLADDET